MADTENPDASNEPKDGAKAPDWTEESFDAERAKRLVANLRAEVADLKGERDTLKSELGTLKANTGTESEKVKEAEARAANAEKALWTERALRKHPELEDFADLLSGDTEEELFKKAERLAAIGKPKDGDKSGEANGEANGEQKPGEGDGGEQKPDAPEIPGKPTPALTPGHGGEENAPFDPVAIAKAARRSL